MNDGGYINIIQAFEKKELRDEAIRILADLLVKNGKSSEKIIFSLDKNNEVVEEIIFSKDRLMDLTLSKLTFLELEFDGFLKDLDAVPATLNVYEDSDCYGLTLRLPMSAIIKSNALDYEIFCEEEKLTNICKELFALTAPSYLIAGLELELEESPMRLFEMVSKGNTYPIAFFHIDGSFVDYSGSYCIDGITLRANK